LKKGFVLLIVIMILGLLGVKLFVMTGSSNKIGFQTNRAFLDAVQQNMISSGIAWTRYNIKRGNIKETGKETRLDTADVGTRDAQLTITIEKITRKRAMVYMDTSCSFGSQSLKNSEKYVVLRKR